MAETGYLWADHGDRDERHRLDLLEARNDPATIAHLECIGVRPGWWCWEVGAGGGSITRWLCDRVGPTGYVLATDIDTRFVDRLDEPNLLTRRHDIVADEPPKVGFDLAHARLVLTGLPGAQSRALSNMLAALAPGGWLLIEEVSILPDGASTHPAWGEVESTWKRLPNTDFDWARTLPSALTALGLRDVQCKSWVDVFQGATAAAQLHRTTFESIRPQLLAAGLPEQRLDEALQATQDPANWLLGPLWFAAWGRLEERPECAP